MIAPVVKSVLTTPGGALTYGERRIPFDSSTEETWKSWQFWVREEPEIPPTF